MTSLNEWRDKCGAAAEANGWHDRWKAISPSAIGNTHDVDELNDHVVAKTALIANEVAEAIEELRNGHNLKEVYYQIDGKPEGYPTELADIIIRSLDMAAMLGIDINQAVEEKLAFNAHRGKMHGGKRI